MLLIIIICSREKAIKNKEHVVQLGGAHHHNNEVAGSSHATNRGNKREKTVAKYLKTCSSIYIITIKAAQYQGYVLHHSTIQHLTSEYFTTSGFGQPQMLPPALFFVAYCKCTTNTSFIHTINSFQSSIHMSRPSQMVFISFLFH